MVRLAGRKPHYQRLAAHAAKTAAQLGAYFIIRDELESEFDVHYGFGVNLDVNYPHDVAVDHYEKGRLQMEIEAETKNPFKKLYRKLRGSREPADIRARQEVVLKWIHDNRKIAAARAGYARARVLHAEAIEMIMNGDCVLMSEDELQYMMGQIRDTVPVVPQEKCRCRHRKCAR